MGEIEQGVPIPPFKPGRKLTPIGMKVRAMQVGDSMAGTRGECKSVTAIARKLGFKATTRKTGETYRVWRTK